MKTTLSSGQHKAFFSRTGLKQGLSIRLTKNIPVAAGLGGGSSNAASTLKALNEMWSNPLAFQDLEEMAVSLGADVPFFLHSRPCIARGIGEILERHRKMAKIMVCYCNAAHQCFHSLGLWKPEIKVDKRRI